MTTTTTTTPVFASTGHARLTPRELFALGPVVVVQMHDRDTHTNWDGACLAGEGEVIDTLTSTEAVIAALANARRIDRFVAIDCGNNCYWEIWTRDERR